MIIANVGGMFSGKSTELIRQGERHLIAGDEVLFFKPVIDDRYSATKIVTHSGKSVEAIPVKAGESISDYINQGAPPKAILIDEIQFFDKSIVEEIIKLNLDGINIYASGLDLNYQGYSFPVTCELMAVADVVQKFKAVCQHCKKDGNLTAKKHGTAKDIVDIGAEDKYIPLCWDCYARYEGSKLQIKL